jgi:hypothetical protein
VTNPISIVVALVATLVFWSGLRAIVRNRTVLRPRYSQEPDSAHTFTGRAAVIIGIAQIIVAVAVSCAWFLR